MCVTDLTFHITFIFVSQPESVQKDLRILLTSCMMNAPSILVLDNLDTLTQIAAEHSQDGEYFNR